MNMRQITIDEYEKFKKELYDAVQSGFTVDENDEIDGLDVDESVESILDLLHDWNLIFFSDAN